MRRDGLRCPQNSAKKSLLTPYGLPILVICAWWVLPRSNDTDDRGTWVETCTATSRGLISHFAWGKEERSHYVRRTWGLMWSECALRWTTASPSVLSLCSCSISSFTVDGGWEEWSAWTLCSVQCERQRRRECNDPPPRHRGKMCDGPSDTTENCTGGMCTQSKSLTPFSFLSRLRS